MHVFRVIFTNYEVIVLVVVFVLLVIFSFRLLIYVSGLRTIASFVSRITS